MDNCRTEPLLCQQFVHNFTKNNFVYEYYQLSLVAFLIYIAFFTESKYVIISRETEVQHEHDEQCYIVYRHTQLLFIDYTPEQNAVKLNWQYFLRKIILRTPRQAILLRARTKTQKLLATEKMQMRKSGSRSSCRQIRVVDKSRQKPKEEVEYISQIPLSCCVNLQGS